MEDLCTAAHTKSDTGCKHATKAMATRGSLASRMRPCAKAAEQRTQQIKAGAAPYSTQPRPRTSRSQQPPDRPTHAQHPHRPQALAAAGPHRAAPGKPQQNRGVRIRVRGARATVDACNWRRVSVQRHDAATCGGGAWPLLWAAHPREAWRRSSRGETCRRISVGSDLWIDQMLRVEYEYHILSTVMYDCSAIIGGGRNIC